MNNQMSQWLLSYQQNSLYFFLKLSSPTQLHCRLTDTKQSVIMEHKIKEQNMNTTQQNMNTTVTPKLNFFRHGNDLKNWNANCWFCQIILMQMEQMLKEIEFIIENRELLSTHAGSMKKI